MDEWIDSYRRALDGDAWGEVDVDRVLELARLVAHGTERKNAPLATFMAGRHVAEQEAAGHWPAEALERAIERAEGLLPGGQTG